jgi:hypothetical protein
MKFKLKYLFWLAMFVGVALMWWVWATGTKETANRLLVAMIAFDLLEAGPPSVPSVTLQSCDRSPNAGYPLPANARYFANCPALTRVRSTVSSSS